MISATARSVAGLLLCGMLAWSILAGLVPAVPVWPGGLCAWVALLLLLRDTAAHQRWVMAIMLAVGAAGLACARLHGQAVSWSAPLTANQELLAMLAAVTFLRLVTPLSRAHGTTRGYPSFVRTLLSTHLFSAVINISALVIVGTHLARKGQADRLSLMLLSRGFSAAAYWSPFFAAMATALTYAPGSSLGMLVACGLPLAGTALLLTLLELRRDPDMAHFSGYPVGIRSLWVPALLAGLVLTLHELLPDAGILTIIAVGALLLSTLLTLARRGVRRGIRLLHMHVCTTLPTLGGELALFLAAGVLAVGLQAIIGSGLLPLPVPQSFGVAHAAGTLLAMLFAALVGVHPLICIAVTSALLLPTGMVPPNLLGALFLAGWALGVALSPFSGTHFTLHGRFGANIYAFPRWNLRYIVLMYLLTVAWLGTLLTTGRL